MKVKGLPWERAKSLKGVGNYKVGDIFVGKIYSDDKLLLTSEWKVV